jgi:pimeloyl-ACP methyl ester carboxylesterase
LATAASRHRLDTLAIDGGQGDAVVFAHGTLMDRTMFGPQRRWPTNTARWPDDPRARTAHVHDGDDLDDLVADCDAVLDGAAIGSCVLGGMSSGGFVALRFALAHPSASTAWSSSTPLSSHIPTTSGTSTRG